MGVDSLPRPRTPDYQISPVRHPSPEFDAVVGELWKRNSRWLGFMPTQGFEERAQRETLLAALVGDQVAGYVLFDLPRDVVKIIHLCVDSAHQGRGVARSLVEAVSNGYQDRRGIELACREDYPANTLWPRLGFITISERTGRSQHGTLLRIWFRNHGHHSLFTPTVEGLDGPRTTAVIDFNIVRDLTGETVDRGLPSQHLLDDWITQLADICITDETYQEAGQLQTLDLRNELRNELEQFLRLPVVRDHQWQRVVSEVSDLVPRAQDPDHRHLADAITGRAQYFVTRDQELTECADVLMDRFGINVVSPPQFITSLDQLRSEDRYEPRSLNATRVSIHLSVDDEPSFIRSFQNYAQSEPRRNLIGILRTAQATPDTSTITMVRTATSRDIGAAIGRIDNGTLVVTALRLSGRDRLSDTVGRQLCSLLRTLALERSLSSVHITDQYLVFSLENSLDDEGYVRTDGDWQCNIDTGFTDVRAVFGHDRVTVSDVALYEHRRWPLKLLGGDLLTFVIPIRPHYAEQLFDTQSAEGTLFGRQTELGIGREHVYYRNWKNAHSLASPARILWYVAGVAPYQAEGHIRAVSQLKEVRVGRPLTLYRQFARLGIYTEAEVKNSAANDGRVMALRFVGTELFDTPISLTRMRGVVSSLGETFPVLQSPSLVSEEFFSAIYREASRYGTR